MSKEQGSRTKEEIGVGKPISLFDVDGTLTKGFAILSFARNLDDLGKLTDGAWAKMQYDYQRYLDSARRTEDYHAFAVDVVNNYGLGLEGQRVEEIQAVAETYFDKVHAGEVEDYTLLPFAEELLTIMNEIGPTFAITGSPVEALNPLKKHIGMVAVEGTQLTIVDGVYTGSVAVNLALGESKNAAVAALIKGMDVDFERSFAFGDSMSDIPLLEVVRNPFVLGSNQQLQEEGKRRRWHVIKDPNEVIPAVRTQISKVFAR